MTARLNASAVVFLSVLLPLIFPCHAFSDILFRAKQPVKIGHGTQDGAKIHWTDCSGQNPEDFEAPPYSLDLTENCSVGPPAFGLDCKGEYCTVVDSSRLQRYMPGVGNGEKVYLNIQAHGVDIRSTAGTIHLEK
ncbi:MAG TPA: hypothetical protein VND65_11255 [Candidatus Binatia bacterium]|nr:hypothetical protein [Candidatus Binatia bacterium]